MPDIYIDNAKRKRIVTFWVPVCLTFTHVWASLLIYAAAYGDKTDMDGETIRIMFSSCVTSIGYLILLLVSDKAVEFLISRLTGSVVTSPQVIEKTTTEKTVVTPAEPSTMEVKADNVTVTPNQ